MLKLTNQQIKALIGKKCPECRGFGIKGFGLLDMTKQELKDNKCKSCNGTGLPTIEIEKEWIESPNFKNSGLYIPKYKIGDIITQIIDVNEVTHYEETTITITKRAIKLKIISETEDKQKIQMVR